MKDIILNNEKYYNRMIYIESVYRKLNESDDHSRYHNMIFNFAREVTKYEIDDLVYDFMSFVLFDLSRVEYDKVKNWLVTYYRYNNFITTKVVKAKTASEAIKKARVKNIIDLSIILDGGTKK